MDSSWDIVVVGSGMGSLTAAALLANDGHKVAVLEQNYLPGGCTSSYWRKGFVFETGATTLVGMDDFMPLKYVLDQTDIQISNRKLDLPMQVLLPTGQKINKYQSLEKWIEEAEQNFGKKNQRAFWEHCYKISCFVWQTSLQQLSFPPSNWSDLKNLVKGVSLQQLTNARYSFTTMKELLKKYDLLENELFVKFVNEQLLITAQNYLEEVNVLFGATALCYTNFGNYYVDGGLINLVNPFVEFVESRGGIVTLRNPVENVEKSSDGGYVVHSKLGTYRSKYLISGLPINNTVKIYNNGYQKKYDHKLLGSEQLNSAFQMGIGFKSNKQFDSIHMQIHLKKPLAGTGSNSIFISFNHEEDLSRCDAPGTRVASISTHLPDPENLMVDKKEVEEEIVNILEHHSILKREDILYSHSSTQKSWNKWTGRAHGFVGGYPQFKNIKPWQMIDARLDGDKAYICGDTTYPGQGIPGVTLSGIIAYRKLRQDWLD